MIPLPLPRRRSSIPIFRRRSSVVVRFLLLFVGIPVSIYIFASSWANRVRKEMLLNELIRDPAWIGTWPDGIRIPVHQRDSGNTENRQRLQSRFIDDDDVEEIVDWRHWKVNGTGGEAVVPFWGHIDVAGPSPFDHFPNPSKDGSGKRVMFLTGTSNSTGVFSDTLAHPWRISLQDYHDYLERMNTHTYEIVDAAIRHPDISRLDVWGPKWRYWDPTVALSENMRRRMWWLDELEKRSSQLQAVLKRNRTATDRMVDAAEGNQIRAEDLMSRGEMDAWWLAVKEQGSTSCPPKGFDLVWTISDIFKQSDPMLDALPCGAILAQQLGDCHALNCLNEWYPNVSNITVTKYGFEMLELFNEDRLAHTYPNLDRQLFGHSIDSANPWDFWPVEWSSRASKAKMFGFTGSFYPLRVTITDYLETLPGGSASLIDRYEHPGYTVWEMPEAYEDPMGTYERGNAAYQHHEALREDFAKHMRHSKICVFDSSTEKKMIRKFAQALLSGCVVAGDIPTENEDILSEFMIELKPTWDIERINTELAKHLQDDHGLERKAMLGFAYARKHFTNTNKITEMLRLVDRYTQGARGYDLPNGLSLKCRAYWGDEAAWRPPWCTGLRGLEK
ncbi:hypothetical protein QFC21_005673 [Naganishia friedmannii]|uniref:Uncharacterized protein n=1 Tax=Naganishia friedmannii TaxID=89922 RepID=A0ACC2V8K3_9TREE|nr:hypothetical protein QFC21_005673 [Naganishia friedmannii]